MSRSAAYFDAIQAHCLTKPGAVLDHPWGEFAFKVGGKMFVVTGDGSPLRLTVKARLGIRPPSAPIRRSNPLPTWVDSAGSR